MSQPTAELTAESALSRFDRDELRIVRGREVGVLCVIPIGKAPSANNFGQDAAPAATSTTPEESPVLMKTVTARPCGARGFLAAFLVAVCAPLSGCEASASSLTEREAMEATNRTLEVAPRLLTQGEQDQLCRELAADVTMCRDSLGSSTESPADSPTPTVSYEQLTTGSWVATVKGTLSNGAEFTSQIELVRHEGGTVRAVDPIYWVERTVSGERTD